MELTNFYLILVQKCAIFATVFFLFCGAASYCCSTRTCCSSTQPLCRRSGANTKTIPPRTVCIHHHICVRSGPGPEQGEQPTTAAGCPEHSVCS